MQRDAALNALAVAFWRFIAAPVAWLCCWPARVYSAIGETELAVVFKCDDAATDPRWTRRALYAVCRRARQASGSRRP